MTALPPPFDTARQRHFDAGEIILHEGETSDALYLIEQGRVEVVLEQAEQGDELVLGILEQDEIFGEMSLFSEEKQRCAMVRSLAETTVRVCDKDSFLRQAEQDRNVWMHLLSQLANRLRKTNRRYSDRAFHNVKTRIAHLLADLADRQTAEVEDPSPGALVKVTRTDLGRMANCSREVAGQAVLELAEEGLLVTSGREIRLTDEDALKGYGQ